MGLSRLRWPVFIALVAGLAWLLTEPGLGYLHTRWGYDRWAQRGSDPQAAASNETRLTQLGGFLMNTMRFEQAEQVMRDAMRYEGDNYWYNLYRLAKVKEKLDQPEKACEILTRLIDENVNSRIDKRVPGNDVLDLRRSKLMEANEIEAR